MPSKRLSEKCKGHRGRFSRRSVGSRKRFNVPSEKLSKKCKGHKGKFSRRFVGFRKRCVGPRKKPPAKTAACAESFAGEARVQAGARVQALRADQAVRGQPKQQPGPRRK